MIRWGINECCNNAETQHLNFAIGGYDPNQVIQTSYVLVKESLQDKSFVSIEGPKECGKT